MHRNIDLDSMGYCYGLDGKTILGVLNDFDLAASLDDQGNGSVSKQRTGTRPYMAIDLVSLKNPPCLHLCRHDLESIMYCIVVLACWVHATKRERERSDLSPWFVHMGSELRHAKATFLSEHQIIRPAKRMKDLSPVVQNVYDLFVRGYLRRCTALFERDISFDHDTWGGTITLERFTELFK